MPALVSLLDTTAVVTITRGGRRNALTLDDWISLRDAVDQISDVRAVVLTGSDGHFSSGMDLSPDNPLIARVGPAMMNGDERAARSVIEDLKGCVQALADLDVPTFAAIEGACIGGGLELALACDVRIAASDAVIALPEVHAGMIPDLGGCVRLTRLIGTGRAIDLICTGRRISGEEAFQLGVVERVVAPGTALAAALAAAAQVATNGPTAVRMALNVVRTAPDLGLAEALAVETRGGIAALTSGEPAEGIQAFFERRPPRWA